MPYSAQKLDSDADSFPHALRNGQHGSPEFSQIWTTGNHEILNRQLLGFFCTTKCPGDVILQVYDIARELRDAAVPVISGFHTSMEKECLDLLLRGKQPVVISPARSVANMRVRPEWKKPLDDERLLIVSPFDSKHRRITATLAEQRNRFVTTLANEILVIHAPANTKTERVVPQALEQGKPVYMLDDAADPSLFDAAVQHVTAEELIAKCRRDL